MNVKKIFMVLITVVACVLIGALVLNIIMPNALGQLSNQIEAQIFNATGLTFDFNGDGKSGHDGYGVNNAENYNENKQTDRGGVAGYGKEENGKSKDN